MNQKVELIQIDLASMIAPHSASFDWSSRVSAQ